MGKPLRLRKDYGRITKELRKDYGRTTREQRKDYETTMCLILKGAFPEIPKVHYFRQPFLLKKTLHFRGVFLKLPDSYCKFSCFGFTVAPKPLSKTH